MKILDIQTLPAFQFAWIYEADSYSSRFALSHTTLDFSYIAEGSLEVTKGEETFIAEKGDILCAIRDVDTCVKSTSYHCHHVVGLEIQWEFTKNQAAGFCIPYITKAGPETEEITQLIDKFIYSSHIYETSPGRTAELFFQILGKIDAISRKSNGFYQPESSLIVDKAKAYIQHHINSPILQKDVAKYVNTSPNYLCSVFKKAEGIPLIKYVNITKLKCIENLMKTEQLPLYKAAEMYGYSDANYVSALYKKLFGHNITAAPPF